MTAASGMKKYLERLRSVADDVVMTFAEFERAATRKICELEAEGFMVRKVMVDVDHMVAWCRRQGYRVNDTGGRAAYGAVLLMARDERDALDAPFDGSGQL